jgi:hypothetical protein
MCSNQPTFRAQGVYIYGCRNCVIQVPSKANVVSVDDCVKTCVVFADLISVAEVVNCRGLQLQCTGYVPTVSVEKTDGLQLYVRVAVTKRSDFQVRFGCLCIPSATLLQLASVHHRAATAHYLGGLLYCTVTVVASVNCCVHVLMLLAFRPVVMNCSQLSLN